MESQPQNPEFSNNPENFHPWLSQTVGMGSSEQLLSYLFVLCCVIR